MQSFFKHSDFAQNRGLLLEKVKQKYEDIKSGAIIVFGAFETGPLKFKQESSFYYLTGINEPGSVLVISLNGKTSLYVPNTGGVRAHWLDNCIDPISCKPQDIGFDNLEYLGEPIKGYELPPFFSKNDYSNLIAYIQQIVNEGGQIFTLCPNDSKSYFESRVILNRLSKFIPSLNGHIEDISHIIARLRRNKSKKEIEALYKAIDITIMGQEAAIQTIEPGKFENEIQGAIEYVFTSSDTSLAFASIVGSGKNSTVLHYTSNNQQMKSGDLVVVDIGAEFNHYCGDITRTYPVSGKFSKRQREIYDIVLETQQYIADLAKPGMWLSNKDKPESSLNHLAKEFIKLKGYDKYFLHGIGHFLGLDVHDVGDYNEPLQSGDVITIEPGIYIAEENIGIRIEDNYWIYQDGAVCLSEQLPKSADEIEKLIKNKVAV